MRILMVCLGNICRSPSAEGVLRYKLNQAGLADKVFVDSAGIGGWHEGDAPDKRAQKAAKNRGYEIANLRARQIQPDDFSSFDVILGMDNNNIKALKQMPQGTAVVDLFLNYALAEQAEVDDPYYGDMQDFDQMLNYLEAGCDAIIQRLKGQL